MALTREDKADVKRKLGKAMANKVAKATRDYKIDPFTGTKTSVKRPTVKMGGTTTRNGKEVNVGMSKEWQRRNAKTSALKKKKGDTFKGAKGATRAANVFVR